MYSSAVQKKAAKDVKMRTPKTAQTPVFLMGVKSELFFNISSLIFKYIRAKTLYPRPKVSPVSWEAPMAFGGKEAVVIETGQGVNPLTKNILGRGHPIFSNRSAQISKVAIRS